jgi:molybdopterin synthase sulfur carrier subunit
LEFPKTRWKDWGENVKIRLYATLRDLIGTRQVDVQMEDVETVKFVLHHLVQQFPQLHEVIWQPDGSLAGYVAVILNGRDIRHLNGIETSVSDEDTLDIFPPVGGGALAEGCTKVNLKFGGELFTRMKGQTLQFEFYGKTLRELVSDLAKEYDLADLLMDGDIPKPYLQMMINGRLWYAVGGWDAVIESGSTVALFQCGGALKPVSIPAETTVKHLKSEGA